MNHVHSELVELARAQMARQNEGHTLQATSLVNEAYLRLVDARYDGWETRHHFFAMVSRIMRTILVDHARRKNSGKRGGGQVGVALETGHGGGEALPDLDLLDLHEALGKLERIDGELAQFVELRYFAGRTVKEIAEMMETPLTTTERRLRTAMAWLREAMGHGGRTD